MEEDWYAQFNNDDPKTTDEQYFEYVALLSERTAIHLRHAKGKPEEQRQILCRYFQRGDKANLTPSELIDFLAGDTPSVLDKANYSEAEGDAVMVISDSLTQEEIDGVEL